MLCLYFRFCFYFWFGMRLLAKQLVEDAEALGLAVGHGVPRVVRKEGNEEAHVLQGLNVADVVEDRLGSEQAVGVIGDLEVTKLSEVKAQDRRQGRVHIFVHLETLVLRVVGRGLDVEVIEDVAHGANDSMDDVRRGKVAPHAVLRELKIGNILLDVVRDMVMRFVLRVDPEHVVPLVGVAKVALFVMRHALVRDLDDTSGFVVTVAVAASLDDDTKGVRGGVHVGDRLVAGGKLAGVANADVGKRAMEVEFLLRCPNRGANVNQSGVFRVVKLLRVIRDAGVLMMHNDEGVDIGGIQLLRECIAHRVGVFSLSTGRAIGEEAHERFVQHVAMRLGGVSIAAAVHRRTGRSAEMPLALVVVNGDGCTLVRHLNALRVGQSSIFATGKACLEAANDHALGDAVGERHHHILALGRVQVDHHAAAFVVEILEVIHRNPLVGVVEEDETAAEKLFHLECRPEVMLAQRCQQHVGKVTVTPVCDGDGDFLDFGDELAQVLGRLGRFRIGMRKHGGNGRSGSDGVGSVRHFLFG